MPRDPDCVIEAGQLRREMERFGGEGLHRRRHPDTGRRRRHERRTRPSIQPSHRYAPSPGHHSVVDGDQRETGGLCGVHDRPEDPGREHILRRAPPHTPRGGMTSRAIYLDCQV